jgi:glycerophosphoryl diester phosphodiesterase
MVYKIIQTILCGCLISCGTPDMKIVAHRGASHDAPENTLASFNLAWAQGADAIEGDFYLTKDSAIVCIHDKNTGRLADQDLMITESTLAQLRELDVGSWKGADWAGEKIPTMEEVLRTVPRGKKIFIEVKCGPEILPALEKNLSASQLSDDQVVVISFNQDVIARVKKQIPQIKAYWLTGFRKNTQKGGWEPSMTEILTILREIKADGLDCSAQEVVDADFAGRLASTGMELHVWTVDDPVQARRFAQIGVRSITTNRPGWLREQLK